MTSAALPAPRLASLRSAVVTDRVAIGALGLLFVALAVLTWGAWGDLGQDTGYDLLAGSRVAHGELPYVDFVYYYGPLAPFVLGLAAWIGGAGVGSAIAVGLAISCVIVGLTYALARTYCEPLPAALAAAIVAGVGFAPTNLSFVLPHTETATFGIACLLLFVLGLSRYDDGASARWLVAAGIAGGLAALTRPEVELAFVVATIVWLAVRLRASASTRREFVLLVAPAAAIPALVYGAFLTQISFHRLAFENLYPVDALRAAGNHVIRLHAPLTASSFAHLGLRALAYAAGVAALIAVATLLEKRKSLLAPALLVAALACVVALMRPETTRYYLGYAYEWIPIGAPLLLAYCIFRGQRRGVAELAVLTVLAALTYDTFTLQATRAQPSVYLAPFVAVLLVRLHLFELGRTHGVRVLGAAWLAFLAVAGIGLAVHDARAEVPVRGPGGAISASRVDAPAYQGALTAIEANTRPGEAILLAPQLTALYTLSGRTDALPQLSLLPGALADVGAERTAISKLSRVRLVVIDRRRFTEYGHTTFGASFDRVLGAWIQRHFVRVATFGAQAPGGRVLDVMKRRRGL